METPEYVVITKTCIGSLTITVTNPSTGAIQRIVLRANEPKRMIPVATAALIYTDTYGGAYRMYKQGYFSFDDPQKVYDYAYNNGLIVGDPELIKQDSSSTYLEDVKKALLSGNRLEIDKFCAKDKGLEDVARVARSCIGELKQSVIKYVEEKIGVSLTVDGE